jgi:lipopolysaccharide export system protein LptC
MSEAATIERSRRKRWAARGGRHDLFVGFMKFGLPTLIGALVAILVIAPLSVDTEMSFLLAKDNVAMAKERLRVDRALYRGQDSKGQFFTLAAASAVQKTSQTPVVMLNKLDATIQLADGPATLMADQADYNMDKKTVASTGMIRFAAADGYSIAAKGVAVDLNARSISSDNGVSGTMPLGSFSARSIRADLESRTIILEGSVRLRIDQGKAKF